MNFCGIICEFNPFHNGHEYIISQAKKITGCEIVCLMSGNFVQRGCVAFQNKFKRAENAINHGATAVIELPTIYACSNAENFALGAVKILNSLGASFIAFGIKNTNLETLEKIARLKLKNSVTFQNAFKNEIENGINFNTALKRAIAKELGDETVLEILKEPNNILAIEYLTAILKLGSKIKPIAIERTDNGFLSEKADSKFLSANAIREKVYASESVDLFVPKNAKIDDFTSKNSIKTLECLEIFKIRELSPQAISKFYDMNEGIEFRIKKAAETFENFDEIKKEICSPRYREPRVNKLLLYPLLNVTKKTISNSFKTKPVAKLLAIKKERKNDFLKKIDKSKINLIVKGKDYQSLNKKQIAVINVDLVASNIFSLITSKKPNLDKKIGTIFI